MRNKIWFTLSIFIFVVLFVASNMLIQLIVQSYGLWNSQNYHDDFYWNIFWLISCLVGMLALTINVVYKIKNTKKEKSSNGLLWILYTILIIYFSFMFYDIPLRVVVCARYLGMAGDICSLKVSRDCFPTIGIPKKQLTVTESFYPMNVREKIFGKWCSSS